VLAWRIEEVSFTNSRYRSYSISIAVHIVIVAVVLYIAHLSIETIEARLLPQDEDKAMPISIVSYESSIKEKKFVKASVKKPKAENNSRINDFEADAVIKLEDAQKHVFNNSVDLPNPPKIERYEQLLAQHIANFLPDIPAAISLPSRVDIWVKIDKNGDIYDFGVLPEQAPVLEDILKSMVYDSSPVPTPPVESFNSEFVQYLIPLRFGR
jgi:hypothetical protein